jgi:hypothetical protein
MKIPYSEFCNIWNDIFTPFNDVADFLALLSKNYCLSLLSNTNDLHFQFLKIDIRTFLDILPNYHLSYKMDARKLKKKLQEIQLIL